ncbi:MAG: LamG domain-containing protein [Bacteroidetes bacterium]|nr:LamG domain-containing protein [Bacteroidota bacterium]
MRKAILFIFGLILTSNLVAQISINMGLIACYPFTGNAQDQSGNGHHGTLYGPLLATDRFSNPGSAYHFDGVNDYIDLGLFSGFTQSNEFSISVWIQPQQVKLQTILMLNPDNFTDRFNAMAYYSHNGVSSTIWDYGNCNAGGRLIQVGTIFSNAWQHWVYTVHPLTGMKVYKNGVLTNSQTTSSTLINRQRNLWIGGGFDAAMAPFYFHGIIDDMRLYDRAVTPSEVATLFTLESLCTPTNVEETAPGKANYLVTVDHDVIKINVLPSAPSSTFTLQNAEGKQIFKKENISGGDYFEITSENISNGLLIYSFKSKHGMIAGKVIY